MGIIEREIQTVLERSAARLGYEYPSGVLIEEPPAEVSADISTNIAMRIARERKENPRALAERLRETILREGESVIDSVEVAGPGFLNLVLNHTLYEKVLQNHTTAIEPKSNPEKVLVEFVSANPTGPLHIGNARGGPIGETIARLLEKMGDTVAREFYVNDIGNQANLFAASVLHYYLAHFGQESLFPEKGYPAEYVRELAEEIVAEEGERYLRLSGDEQREAIRQTAIKRMVEKMEATCNRMGISFDRWFWQSELATSGLSKDTLGKLTDRRATVEKDGAVWLKSGISEDDRESVLVRSDGTYTYFLDDLAYHWDKLAVRHFDRTVVLLGANHFGHIPRMKAGLKGMGLDPARYEGVMYQYVQI
ncbi:arginine--tRNA ligase, partial [Patescibacteria group bacterium]|nr:arginine--tRNA ligase [Patescibacteria group bacterium]